MMFADCESAGDHPCKRRRVQDSQRDRQKVSVDVDYFAAARESAASGLPPMMPAELGHMLKPTPENPGRCPTRPYWSADKKSYCQTCPMTGKLCNTWVVRTSPRDGLPPLRHPWTTDDAAQDVVVPMTMKDVSYHRHLWSAALVCGYTAWASDPFGFCEAPEQPSSLGVRSHTF